MHRKTKLITAKGRRFDPSLYTAFKLEAEFIMNGEMFQEIERSRIEFCIRNTNRVEVVLPLCSFVLDLDEVGRVDDWDVDGFGEVSGDDDVGEGAGKSDFARGTSERRR